MPIEVKGVGGEVRWGYHRAAIISTWNIRATEQGATLLATTTQIDTFAVSQRPLVFAVPRPNGVVWRWSVVSLQVSGDRLTAALAETEG